MNQAQELTFLLANHSFERTPHEAYTMAVNLAFQQSWEVDDAFEFLIDLYMPANDESRND